MQIEEVGTEELKPYEKNSRTHSKKQIGQIAKSIEEFGFTNPILIDEDNGVIAGHGRLMAAKSLKQESVPCIRLTGLTEKQRKAYIIADNKIAEGSGWDDDMLKLELEDLVGGDFDLESTGFDTGELDKILNIDEEVVVGEDNMPTQTQQSEEYEASSIRQIILIYGKDDYEEIVKAMGAYAERHGLASNTDVVTHMLKQEGVYGIQDDNAEGS
ncbi:MAG: hypothetical protein CMF45_08615 [Legionellales bacterium]|nr:hypothetical protein [Legionellales bacterium]|tara:strand:- start:1377 stop:2018 length:642 start_codon:yes stop_codon:yes gene_type:complete